MAGVFCCAETSAEVFSVGPAAALVGHAGWLFTAKSVTQRTFGLREKASAVA
jgi:hypothetical protein